MTTKLERGKQNGVRNELYQGSNPDNIDFDVQNLYAYMVERAEQTYPCNMDGAIDLFEREFHRLPPNLKTNLRNNWNSEGISDMPDGDDLKNIAAVSTLVEQYADYYSKHPSQTARIHQPVSVTTRVQDRLEIYTAALAKLGRMSSRRIQNIRG